MQRLCNQEIGAVENVPDNWESIHIDNPVDNFVCLVVVNTDLNIASEDNGREMNFKLKDITDLIPFFYPAGKMDWTD